MILRLIPVLLLVPVLFPNSSSSPPECLEPTKGECTDCLQPDRIPGTEPEPDKITCLGSNWFFNGNYFNKTDPLYCVKKSEVVNGENVITKAHWQRTKTWTEEGVTNPLCVTDKLCSLSHPLDFVSVRRPIQPLVYSDKIRCPKSLRVQFSWNNPSTRAHKTMNANSIQCNKTDVKWKAIFDNGRGTLPVSFPVAVYCQTELEKTEETKQNNGTGQAEKKNSYKEVEEDDQYDEEFAWVWEHPYVIGLSAALGVLVATTITYALFHRCAHKRVDKYADGVFSEHWNGKDAVIEWNWKVVLDFIDTWEERTIDERVTFLEKGYWELGYKSTITQMLYLFEFMLIVENHHIVWRPMIYFLHRLRRLAGPPFIDIDISDKFNSWIAYQGEKLIDQYGFYPFDVDSYCDSDPDSESESECSCDEEEKKEGGDAKKDEGKKEEEKASEGGETRKAAGADEVKKEDGKGVAAPAAVAAAPEPVPPCVEAPPGVAAASASLPLSGPAPVVAVGAGEPDYDEDPHNAYLRYLGVFLMNLGNGAGTKLMYGELDSMYENHGIDVDGPMRAALAVTRITRDPDNMAEFDKLWQRLASGLESDTVDEEWGSLHDHCFFGIGHVLSEEPLEIIANHMVNCEEVTAKQICWWFRGSIERGGPSHLPFLLKHHENLAKKMPMDSDGFYECMQMFCLFDHTDVIWDMAERLVIKDETLTKRLNVAAYRRRADHFNWHFRDHGKKELLSFFSHPIRLADIEEADFEIINKAVVGRPASD